jgi:nitrogen fixation/metabolism regulation signal transduction histidine kinase
MKVIHDEKEFYQSVLDNLPGGFLSVNLEGAVMYINPTAGKILHLEGLHDLIGKSFELALGKFPALCDVVRDSLATHHAVHRAEISILHADVPLIIGYSTIQVKNPQGEHLGMGIIFQDLTFVKRKTP